MNSKTFVTLAFTFLLTLGIFAFFTIPEEKKEPHYKLTTVVIFQNDAPWLREWIEYYKMLGADHMLFYNNESTDNFHAVLDPYIKSGLVELINYPNRPHKDKLHAWVYATQVTAYQDAVKRMKGKTKWITFVDTDEFIVPHHWDSLPDALKAYEGIGGVALNWCCFGTGNIDEIPDGKLLIESLTKRAETLDPMNLYTKVVVQPEYVNRVASPHYTQMKKGRKLIHTDFTPLVHPVTHSHKLITVNHYISRTKNYLTEKIRKKELMNQKPLTDQEKEFYYNTANTIEDPDKYIFRFVPQLKERMKQ